MGRHKDEVNISKSQFIVHSFYFMLEAARICMVPFLTLFFRRLGLTALQAGAVFGLKALTWCLMAPFWTRISGNCGMKKGVFLLSIFMYAATYLVITLVPPTDKDFLTSHCNLNKTHFNSLTNETHTSILHQSGDMDLELTSPSVATVVSSTMPPQKMMTFKPEIIITPKNVVSVTVTTKPTISVTVVNDIEDALATTISTISKSTTSTRPTTKYHTVKTTSKDSTQVVMQKLMKYYNLSIEELAALSKEDLQTLLKGMEESDSTVSEDDDQNRSLGEADSSVGEDKQQEGSGYNGDTNYVEESFIKRSKRYLSTDTRRSISDALDMLRQHVFILVAVVVIVGELFSAPLAYLADNLWFWFLDGIDASEHYGHHTVVSMIAAAIFAMVVTTVIDNTSCVLLFEIDHFMIHFYMFAGLMLVVFLLGFCFPSPVRNSKSQKKKKLTWRALCLIVKDRLHILCLLSVFILGGLRAAVVNYLFWLIEDFGTSETTFGFMICISSVSSIPVLILQKTLIKKISAFGVVSLAFFVFSAQALYYSFLWSFWAGLPIQVLTGCVETGFWIGIKSISSFHTTSPAVDREVQMILENVYYGLGLGIGSIVSGWVVEIFGFSILYQCVSVAALVWGVIFVGVWRLTKTKDRSLIRYSKLNLAGDDDGISDHGFDEDDWLEVALKDER